MRLKNLSIIPVSLLLFAVIAGSTTQVLARNGNTYSVPFSNNAPLLDAVFDDPEWALATNTTYQINNPVGYRLSGYIADFSIALLGTPSGLHIALTLTMVQLDSSGMGFEDPGFYIQFDTDNDEYLNTTNFTPSPDDDFYAYVSNNAVSAGSSPSSWSSRSVDYSMIGDLQGRNLTRTLRAEVRYSYLQSSTVTQTIGVNFGIRYHILGGPAYSVYTFMVDSGDRAYNTVRSSSQYTPTSFSTLVLNPGVAIDMYPPTLNLLTPVSGTDGVYDLSVAVTDVNDIISVEFSEDGTTWSAVNQVVNDPVRYMYSWNSSGFTGDSLYFRATDNQSNTAILTIDVTMSQPGGDYEFFAVLVDNSSPLLNVISPASNSVISGVYTIQIEALDPAGVVMVDWRIGEGAWKNMFYNLENGLWEATWDTTNVSDGSYALSFKSRDSVNNSAMLFTSVTVDKTVPVEEVTVTDEITVTTTETSTETSTETLMNVTTSVVTVTANSTTNSTGGTDVVDVPFSLTSVFVSIGFLVILIYRRRR